MRTPKLVLLLSLAPAVVDALPEARAQAPAPAPAPVSATTPAEPLVLSLDEALAAARRSNRDLQIGQARIAQAAATLQQAWTALFPTVVAQGKYTHNNKEVALSFPVGMAAPGMMPPTRSVVVQKQEQLDGVINATLPVLVPWAYPALSAARLGEQAAEANLRVTEANVLHATAQTYFALVGADEVLRARRSAVEVARKTLDNARVRLDAGTATRVDVSRAELAVVRAEQIVREAEYAVAQTGRALSTLTQIDRPLQAQAQGDAGPAPAAEVGIGQALQLRPEFRALGLGIDAANAQASASRWRWAPTLSAFANYRVFNYVGFSGDKYAWAVGAQLDWALFDSGAREAQRKLALAQARENQARFAQLQDTVRDDLRNQRQLLDIKRSGETAAARSVALARDTLDLVRTQYQAGATTQLEILTAQDALVAAEVALAQAHVEARLADLALRRSAGTFPGK